jgi:hypothetical protein
MLISRSFLKCQVASKKNKKKRLFPFAVVFSILILLGPWSLRLPPWMWITTATMVGILLLIIYLGDQLAKTVVLFYDLDTDVERAYQALHDAFAGFQNCAKTWRVTASGDVTNPYEQKRVAGASTIMERKETKLALRAPAFISTNLIVPSIFVGKRTLFFFPDRLLIYEGKKVGAIAYADLEMAFYNAKCVAMDESLPKDARIVDYTWQYVNKNGGPDRRFKDNKKFPIVLYSEIHFTSNSGLNELLQLSKCELGEAFARAIEELNTAQMINPTVSN